MRDGGHGRKGERSVDISATEAISEMIVKPGSTPEQAANQAAWEALKAGEPLGFCMFEIAVVVNPGDSPERILERYYQAKYATEASLADMMDRDFQRATDFDSSTFRASGKIRDYMGAVQGLRIEEIARQVCADIFGGEDSVRFTYKGVTVVAEPGHSPTRILELFYQAQEGSRASLAEIRDLQFVAFIASLGH